MPHRAFLVSSLVGGCVLVAAAACGGAECVRLADGSCQAAASPTPGTSTPGDASTADAGGVPGSEGGSKPNGAHISLDCTPGQLPAFAEHDCLYSHLQEPRTATCTLKMADRLGVIIGTATPVSFMAEAGAISPVATSPAYPGTRDTLGHADGYLEVFASPLPPDVTPLTGERSAPVDFGCGLRTANPRDGYVTVIAWVLGEEGFVDQNRNGQYDPGEPFVDLGEPFVDENDNGKWDSGQDPRYPRREWFLDVDGNGTWTPPNGKWDSDAVLWTETRVVFTGRPAFAVDAQGNEFLTRIFGTGVVPDPTPAATPFVASHNSPAVYGVFFTDALLNPLDASATYSVASVSGIAVPTLGRPVLPFRTPPQLFRLLYCDHPQYPATCHDGPAESGCRTAPCYVIPEVGLCLTANCAGFEYGEVASLSIDCAKDEFGQTKVGPDTVWVSAEVAEYTTSFGISGRCN